MYFTIVLDNDRIILKVAYYAKFVKQRDCRT